MELFNLFNGTGAIGPRVGVWDNGIVVNVSVDAESFAAGDPHGFLNTIVPSIDSVVNVGFVETVEARCLLVD